MEDKCRIWAHFTLWDSSWLISAWDMHGRLSQTPALDGYFGGQGPLPPTQQVCRRAGVVSLSNTGTMANTRSRWSWRSSSNCFSFQWGSPDLLPWLAADDSLAHEKNAATAASPTTVADLSGWDGVLRFRSVLSLTWRFFFCPLNISKMKQNIRISLPTVPTLFSLGMLCWWADHSMMWSMRESFLQGRILQQPGLPQAPSEWCHPAALSLSLGIGAFTCWEPWWDRGQR